MSEPKLTILTSHPIQYQVPIWRALAAAGIDMQVLFLHDQGLANRVDSSFGASFAWDIDLLGGYPSEFVKVHARRDKSRFRGLRLAEHFQNRFPSGPDHFFWSEGWRHLANWQAISQAKRQRATILMRGDSHGLAPRPWHKRLVRSLFLKSLLAKVDYFLCVGSANQRYYQELGVPAAKCVFTPHSVDNDRFAEESAKWRGDRKTLREQWKISPDAKVVLFCGKLQSIKNPQLINAACKLLQGRIPNLHVLYVGTGALEGSLRALHDVKFSWDAETKPCDLSTTNPCDGIVPATFAGFLNQSEIGKAYAVSDVVALPSHSETWGLVVNEAMASGIPAVVSDQVGCAEDLPARLDTRLVFPSNDAVRLSDSLAFALENHWESGQIQEAIDRFSIRHVVAAVSGILNSTPSNLPGR